MMRPRNQSDYATCTASGAVGIGLRAPHYSAFLSERPAVGFVEIHSENFFGREGMPIGGRLGYLLDTVRRDTPISLHGVGLSLGSAEPVDTVHLQQLQYLVERCEPFLISEHLSWTGFGGTFANDLLPLPYTEEALALIASNIQRVQDVLKRPLLIENPSRYLAFAHSSMSEPEFITALIATTGCGLLLDINNVHVSAANIGFDATEYLAAIPTDAIAEIHLAGFSEQQGLLIDTHSRPVAEPVWALYERFVAHAGPRPTLIEWDADLPPLPDLLNEAEKAEKIAKKAMVEVGNARAG